MILGDPTVADRFWAKVVKTDRCWLWVGARSTTGYGNFYVKNSTKNGLFVSAHRVAWCMENGPLPTRNGKETMVVRHRCDNRGCVRPEHLRLGTQKENQREMVRKRRNCPQGIRTNSVVQEPVEEQNRRELLDLRRTTRYRRTRPLKYHSLRERLEPYIPQPNENGCWIWTRAKNRAGYGLLNANGSKLAHRVSWEVFRSPIPEGLHVCHHCDCPPCWNPEHLFLGTDLDNTRDAVAKNRIAPTRARGERSGAAKLTEADVRIIRSCPESNVSLAARYGVGVDTISEVRNHRTWRHIG
jgi:hypothetical protein